jgi:sialic acid synthase SpsE/sugar phosphate isomerase/epimerase
LFYIKDIDKFIVSQNLNFFDIVNKIQQNQIKCLIVVDDAKRVVGVISLGDIAMSLKKSISPSDLSAINIMNNNFVYAKSKQNFQELSQLLQKYRFLPLLDSNMNPLLIIAGDPNKREFRIGNHSIRSKEDFILIAEIGNNHNGSIMNAFELIKKAKYSGAHIAKFQMRDLSLLYGNIGHSQDLSTEYVVNLLQKNSMKHEELFECFDFCKEIGITPLCTPFDLNSLERLEHYGMDGYKIGSCDLSNYELLNAVIETEKPIILSTGMSNDEDIDSAIKILEDNYSNYVLCHTNSTYPTPYTDVNLDYIDTLKSKTNSVIGYSGHERGFHIPLAAFIKGAQVIEKHYTLDKNQEGNDHKVSLLPDEFLNLKKYLDDISKSFGIGYKREITQGEAINRVALAKSIFCSRPIKKGDLINESNITIRSPGNGLSPKYKNALIGRQSLRDIESGEPFQINDLEQKEHTEKIRNINNFKWAIPVRHRDVYKLHKLFKPPAIEFHLSAKDLTIKDEEILKYPLDSEVIIHAPEQFDEDFIIDLFSENTDISNHSIKLLDEVFLKAIKICELLKFKQRPKVIVNCGGHSKDKFLEKSEQFKMIKNFIKNYKKLNMYNCRFLAQTMPPFPWHFGGQAFHNQFTSSDNIINILNELNNEVEICLDISHSFMWCNYSNDDIFSYIEKISPFIAHIHISDAANESEEGLQIGKGNINFRKLLNVLLKVKSRATLLPEIWQGHDDDGQGFRIALNKLANYGY